MALLLCCPMPMVEGVCVCVCVCERERERDWTCDLKFFFRFLFFFLVGLEFVFLFILVGVGFWTFELRASHLQVGALPLKPYLQTQNRGLNSDLPTSKTGILLLEAHFQFILFWLFWKWCFMNYLWGWLQTMILLISVPQVARIISLSTGT
jgi:hypothetical protein